jgi:hypothetical protein
MYSARNDAGEAGDALPFQATWMERAIPVKHRW